MKVVFLHGLGQTARDWQTVVKCMSQPDVDCPELFSLAAGDFTYSGILSGLEKLYEQETEPFILCGLSLGGHTVIIAAHGDYQDYCNFNKVVTMSAGKITGIK